jgi:hypothetical protein
MGRRRMLLLVAVLLGVTALAASLSPTPRVQDDEGESEPPPPPPRAEPAPPSDAPLGSMRLRFDAARPATHTVPPGSHVVIEVDVPEPAEVSVPVLGLAGVAQPGTPATFDVLLGERRAIELQWTPTDRPTERAGTLVVE